jgi:hypothetical protein
MRAEQIDSLFMFCSAHHRYVRFLVSHFSLAQPSDAAFSFSYNIYTPTYIYSIIHHGTSSVTAIETAQNHT